MMRWIQSAGRLLVLTVMVLAWGMVAAQAKDPIKCERCGMYWAVSPTSLTVHLKGEKADHYFESMSCLFQTYALDKLATVEVVDYAAGDEVASMIPARSAYYLYDTKHLSHSMPPFIAAFKSKDAALKAQKELGGDYMTFDQVWAALGKHFKKKGGH
jgi:hypothetical protein